MPTLYIPTPLRRFTDSQAVIQLEGGTVAELLSALAAQHTTINEQLYDAQGQLKRHIAVFVNEDDIRDLQGVATPLSARDEVSIIPAIAGGCEAPRRC